MPSLGPRDRARIAFHLDRGLVVPDSLVRRLFAAYYHLEPAIQTEDAEPAVLSWVVAPETKREAQPERGEK